MVTVTPYIPAQITVHLGPPTTSAANVTVSFADYVKNVASSEIYPTWEDSALVANILAIISFALNRVYTEFYRSRGYDFDITSSTAIDQKFINGRNIFENVGRSSTSSSTPYLRRQGFVEPLAAKFCNGTTVTCDGLSQWGSPGACTAGAELRGNSPPLLRRGYRDRPQRAHARLRPLLRRNAPAPRLAWAAGRAAAGHAQPHRAELPRHPTCCVRRRHFRHADGKCRAGPHSASST